MSADYTLSDIASALDLNYIGKISGRRQSAKLNVQGLARKDERLMRCLEAPAGFTYVSADLSSGEPTVTAHFSGDKNYYDATFGMVGKLPFYQGNLLKIDDIYLTSASFSPMADKQMKEAFHSKWRTLTFSEQWLEDAEVIKGDANIKPIRVFHKPLVLGIGYSMGARKLVATAYDHGHVLPFPLAKKFFENYWTTYGDVARLGKMLQAKFKRDGSIINPFGYRLIPDKDYKALNYFIQSSVSGIMHILCAKFFAIASYALFVTIIHDELIMLIPNHLLAEAEIAMRQAEASLNADLKWRVKIRVGWKSGKDMYEAH